MRCRVELGIFLIFQLKSSESSVKLLQITVRFIFEIVSAAQMMNNTKGDPTKKRLAEVCLIKKREYPDDPKDLDNLAANLHKFEIYHIFEIITDNHQVKTVRVRAGDNKHIASATVSTIAEGVPRPRQGQSYDYSRYVTKDGMFRCPFTNCGKVFSKSSYLREHLFTHDSQKPFTCDGCGKAFAIKKYMLRHSREYCPPSSKYTGRKDTTADNSLSTTENVPTDNVATPPPPHHTESANDDGDAVENEDNQTMGSLWDNGVDVQQLLEQQQSYYQEMNDVNATEKVTHKNGEVDENDDENNGHLSGENTECTVDINAFDFL